MQQLLDGACGRETPWFHLHLNRLVWSGLPRHHHHHHHFHRRRSCRVPFHPSATRSKHHAAIVKRCSFCSSRTPRPLALLVVQGSKHAQQKIQRRGILITLKSSSSPSSSRGFITGIPCQRARSLKSVHSRPAHLPPPSSCILRLCRAALCPLVVFEELRHIYSLPTYNVVDHGLESVSSLKGPSGRP